jgi:hypothetical protein
MTRAPTRTHFHSSRLARVLTDLAVVDAAEAATAFAERLGLWVNYTDAIALYAVHNTSAPDTRCGAQAAASRSMEDAFARTRTSLERAILRSGTPMRGQIGIALPMPQADMPSELNSLYEPYRRYYLAHQREMELQLGSLRASVRGELADASPALQQLGALDEVLEGILSEREAKLLATLPLLLKKRFAHWYQWHQHALAETQQTDNPLQWMQPQAWLARFCQEVQTVLLAELDLRLQPALGLLEALHKEKEKQR